MKTFWEISSTPGLSKLSKELKRRRSPSGFTNSDKPELQAAALITSFWFMSSNGDCDIQSISYLLTNEYLCVLGPGFSTDSQRHSYPDNWLNKPATSNQSPSSLSTSLRPCADVTRLFSIRHPPLQFKCLTKSSLKWMSVSSKINAPWRLSKNTKLPQRESQSSYLINERTCTMIEQCLNFIEISSSSSKS